MCFTLSLVNLFPIAFKPFTAINSSTLTDSGSGKTPSLFFTYCQVPVVYKIAGENSIEILFNNGTTNKLLSLNLDIASSAKLFDRTGEIQQIIVSIDHQKLINS